MVGNATEEALLRDQKHPSHRDRPVWPFAVALALLGAGWLVMDLLAPFGLPIWAEASIGAAIVVPIGIAMAMLVRRRSRRLRPAQMGMDARTARQSELDSRIAAARASGAFDKWEARGGKDG